LDVNVNQRLDVLANIRQAQALEEFDLVWYEEPVLADDIAACAEVARSIRIPVATGENNYTRFEFRELVERGAARYLMPDVCRANGFSETLRIGRHAAAHQIAIAPHGRARAVAPGRGRALEPVSSWNSSTGPRPTCSKRCPNARTVASAFPGGPGTAWRSPTARRKSIAALRVLREPAPGFGVRISTGYEFSTGVGPWGRTVRPRYGPEKGWEAPCLPSGGLRT